MSTATTSFRERLRDLWLRLRGWRRISFTGPGVAFTVGALAVGFAAINTGNNLLYLLLGAMLGLVALSGWLSEQTLRGLEVRRRTPSGVPVGQEAVVRYTVRNRKRWMPSLAVEIGEADLDARAFLVRVGPGESVEARTASRFVRRGVYPLDRVTLATGFPFGLFRKARDVRMPGELVVWPRTDRRATLPGASSGRRPAALAAASRRGTPGPRGEYRGLREYRPGDDPRDIHWKTSARLPSPAIRQYDRDAAADLWICMDLRARGEEAEAVVETAASLAARLLSQGRRVGLSAGSHRVDPGAGPGHLDPVLDRLARVDLSPDAPPPRPPADAVGAVLVRARGRPRSDPAFGASLTPAQAPPPPDRRSP
jgi:uncharacterized protein (DUF58 family)